VQIIDKPIVYPIETTGLWGEAVRQRGPVVTNDYAAPNPLKRGTPEGHVPVIRHMNIPVFDGRRIVAVAGVGNKPADYNERDLRQLQLLMEGWWHIAAQKQYELNLAHALDAAEAATRAKSRFLANMSHEIRTPMTAILGYTELLTDSHLDESSRNNYLAVIQRNGKHLMTLINDILDLSKIEAGKFTLDLQRCSVVSMVADVASIVRPRAVQRGVSLEVEYTGEIPETILADNARIRQAVINLAGNAVKFTERGSVRLVVSYLPLWEGQPAVKIDVIDTGIGIQPEVLPELFQSFNQGDASITRKFGGTGLGLAISRHIAQMLGGQLTVQSTWGKGSKFTLTIPTGSLDGVPLLQKPSEIACESEHPFPSTAGKRLDGVRILLAEDGYDNRKLIQTFLHSAGAAVETAENGQEAVIKAEAEPFDVILMDMNMPVMNGYTATRTLRDRGYAMPIFALTANAMSTDGLQCLAAGCNEHLAKPIDRGKLIRTIAAAVGKEPMESENAAGAATSAVEEERLTSLFINDPDVAGILEGFVARLDEQIGAMRHALAGGRYEELQRYAHRLKGAGGCYGYPAMTDACKILEDAAKAQNAEAASYAIDTVIALSRSIAAGYEAVASTGRN
jgi:signal transduction histidine kinase/CheY-like chemotaxis protein/HPt (histidine-containing phosphotransfer) domain-containing protein